MKKKKKEYLKAFTPFFSSGSSKIFLALIGTPTCNIHILKNNTDQENEDDHVTYTQFIYVYHQVYQFNSKLSLKKHEKNNQLQEYYTMKSSDTVALPIHATKITKQ